MVKGVTPVHKGLAPSRLINYFSVVKKMPMLGTHSLYIAYAAFGRQTQHTRDVKKQVFSLII
tara:strand:- start:116 stop:301 length:186 start_codon:yes stop_codon:yes gene_type:complete